MITNNVDNKTYIQIALKAVGLTQREMADIMGIDQAALSRTLEGLRKLTPNEAEALSKATHLDYHDILIRFGLVSFDFSVKHLYLETRIAELEIINAALVNQIKTMQKEIISKGTI
jgi:transcriptional regulator with XRE-family HTH domain